MVQENKGSLYAIISGLCYGLVGYFGISLVNANLSLFNMLFWRFLTSSLLVGLIIIATHKAFNDDLGKVLKILVYGATFYTATSITYFLSSMYIGTGLAMVIFFTYPSMIMFFNWFYYRKPIPKTYYVAIALIIIGMILLTDISELKCDLIGISLGILSAVFYAGYILSNKKNNTVSPFVSTFMVSIGCMTLCFILSMMHRSFVIPSTLGVWGNIFGLSIICTAVPILLLLESLKYISAEKASIL